LRNDAPAQANAFIRAHFHIEPDTLQLSQWNELSAQAYFIEQTRMEFLAKLLSELFKAVFGKKTNGKKTQ
jgi:hypothetical protein